MSKYTNGQPLEYLNKECYHEYSETWIPCFFVGYTKQGEAIIEADEETTVFRRVDPSNLRLPHTRREWFTRTYILASIPYTLEYTIDRRQIETCALPSGASWRGPIQSIIVETLNEPTKDPSR